MTLFRCDGLLTPAGVVEPADLPVTDGIVATASEGPVEHLRGTVVPGFVDLQCNGLAGRNVQEAAPDAVTAVAQALLAHGVVAWLPTVVSSSEEVRLHVLDAVAQAREANTGARILGVHLEGPWISPARAGAHDPDAIRSPSVAAISRSLRHHPGLVRLVTVAPELDGGLEAIQAIVEMGAVASIGHTDATYEQALAAADAGAGMATHLFNAMRPLHQRDPGVVGAVLDDDRLTAGLIADGLHVDPALVRLVHRAKGAEGVALVSDAVGLAGDLHERAGAAYLPDGTLAGALAGLDTGVANTARWGLGLPDAVRSATAIPAAVLGEDAGGLDPGGRADFTVLDENLRPVATYLGGVQVWPRGT